MNSDINRKEIEHKSKNNPLIVAASRNNIYALEFLLTQEYYDIDSQPGDFTALMLGAKQGSYEACKMLLEHGANKEIVNRFGDTAYEIAKNNGNENICELLSK